MMDWWGPVIWVTYGGMEGAATNAKPQRWLEKPGTVGRAVKGMTITILDDDGRELAPGQTGNVYLESDVPTFEYRNDPELTASVHQGRAFTLGDVGYLDEDGYLFLRDRAKDLIISGGVNIYSAEIEGVLTSHPLVRDVADIGVPDAEWGECVKAVVELTDGSNPSPELESELIEWCRSRLARYKCPRSVDFRDALPRNETGKLFKRRLREEYRRGRRPNMPLPLIPSSLQQPESGQARADGITCGMVSSFEDVVYETERGRARIILNRPEKLNAVGRGMSREIHDALWEADDDTSVHSVIIKGAGRSFCVGADLASYRLEDDQPDARC